MSATTATRPPAGAARRSPSTVSGTGSPSTTALPRGATARAAASPRLTSSLSNTPGARRGSLKGAVSPPPAPPVGSRESLVASLKSETDEKEKLLVQLQDKDQTITSLQTENANLTSSLHAAETRLGELYADQTRMEEEMSARIEVAEKLRNQVRELEKEKRDSQRRYNEQTASFEAERQSFYDNEQHLKSRIQSLSQARKQPIPPIPSSPSVASIVISEADTEQELEPELTGQDVDDEQEPAEMAALRLELSTLSTSHASLQSTLHLLQSQLNDLKRVNNELQEENESYNILLREKTLTGQFDVLRMGGAGRSEADGDSAGSSDDGSDSGRDEDSLVSRDTGRSTLDPVHELAEEGEIELEEPEMDPQFQQPEDEQDENEPSGRPRPRHGRKRSSVIIPRGESLANLPITGPGLDLAAELGRAENKDILGAPTTLDDRTNVEPKRKNKKGSGVETTRKVSAMSDPGLEHASAPDDMDALRNEVKSLKDANKALSLYASKIIDRIISQEGFEHVLAVEWDKPPSTPATATAATVANGTFVDASPAPPPKKARPQTMMFSRSTPSTTTTTPVIPAVEKLTTFESLRSPSLAGPPPANQPPSSRSSRRSMSFDWRSFSMFTGQEKKPEPAPQLRPLTLKAGASPLVTGARKLDTQEDEEDRKERERLNATMKLMGIEKPDAPTSPLPPMLKSFSSPGPSGISTADSPPLSAVTSTPTTAVAPAPSRFSFFRRTSSVRSSETSSINSSQGPSHAGTPSLTQEALEQADAEASLAALDAHERQLSAEIAKGSGGGFTEITRRSGDRRSSKRSGSGSTVFSAGMSTRGDED